MPESEEKPLVVIRSLVYNHEPYLRDCLEGFVMQQTTFPFVAVVHDDCSTDGSAAIIREYAEKYPHIIKPVYETENQYSKKDGSLRRAMNEACGKYGAKYFALCEGDDYWTDPHKLQKQVDFLETHPEYAMVCCNCEVHMLDKKLATHEDFIEAGWAHSDEDRELTAAETFEQHGRYAHTAGLVYRQEVRQMAVPSEMNKLNGDIRLQYSVAMTGKIYHMRDNMFVYRYMCAGSWTEREKNTLTSYEETHRILSNYVNAMRACDAYTGGKHHESICKSIEKLISWQFTLHPAYHKELIRDFKEMLLYKYVSSYFYCRSHSAYRYPAMLRLVYFPFFPLMISPLLVNPLMRPFYRRTGAKHSLHIGPFNFITHIVDEPRGHWYVLGVHVR